MIVLKEIVTISVGVGCASIQAALSPLVSGRLMMSNSTLDIEQVWGVAELGKESILFGCIYRPKIRKGNRGENRKGIWG